ncbi:bifunctional hydroxymethylpyrimidine kinase/phosphomethylpyrimidine kinase [Methanolobus halotolerans]|uniref:Bifunctional hydroxymethylpyrimidine kinase/phosphomethylpyrimidine kinase n=1 Tax=Methanolobus halotolerans TaxID=2052935 RepID=A0A4E0PY05_9EURY|nr:bifunctional hydroxymethylpyrimidine kinase/phosphomethylpyrimidine kinase [Methanolobus halotolerans]TGC08354.1 bifunctional hydroxymethylpyrimidine kinase/phosphomethylpyrimidine kinase [Methanolobus halotolerans]
MTKVTVVMTIAGSDSGGGAGIEADIKTFSALGAHGTCAITSVTSQNTMGVLSAFDLPEEVIRNQIDAVCSDMHIEWAKSGMLSSPGITSTVAEMVSKYGIKLVVDPVMAAEAGGALLRKEAIATLKEDLLPLSYVVTPNISEAVELSGMKITNIEEAKNAARAIAGTGVKAVIVTGGHLDASDVVYESETQEFTVIPGNFVRGGTHGSGCTYSASLTCFLAQGMSLPEAARNAKEFIIRAIQGSKTVGKGVGPVNPLAGMLSDSGRYAVLEDLKEAARIISSSDSFGYLIPEVGSNIAMAIPDAKDKADVAAVEGRIVRLRGLPEVVGNIDFGASSHVARIILAAMNYDSRIRAAVNVRYSEGIIEICRQMDLSTSSFDRKDEPEKAQTMDWGTCNAIERHGSVPDIIYDKGGPGKEPMIRVLGKNARNVTSIAISISERYKKIQTEHAIPADN